MRRKVFLTMAAAAVIFVSSCTKDDAGGPAGDGTVWFGTKSFSENIGQLGIKDSDPDSYHFSVTDVTGTVYEGVFADRPDTLRLKPGMCTFGLYSREYDGPEFDSPVYGDYVVKDVSEGESFTVDLTCRQLTCGVQVNFSGEFTKEFPDGFVRIIKRDTTSSVTESGDYMQESSGFLHFMPGRITVNLMENAASSPELLTGRMCSASDMLSVTVRMADIGATGSVQVEVDTMVVRHWETYDYGRKRTGRSVYDAVGVADLAGHSGDTLWVAGYVTGFYVNGKWHQGIDDSAVTANISISSSPDVSSSGCVTVPASVATGRCRGLNLKENPQMLGERVAIYGLSGTLYDLTGIKKSVDYVLL